MLWPVTTPLSKMNLLSFLMRGLLIGTTILLNGNEYDSGTADEETGQDYVCTFT